MSRKLTPVWLLLALFSASEAGALGLGDIRLQSALNEPLQAEIELISATPEELAHLSIRVAGAETFERYGIDRPGFLARMSFQIVPSGRTDGNIVRVTTPDPVTEPFLTFLVEAVWTRGRLLREYTVLLDPPTFVREPVTQAAPVVTAPSRAAPADSGRIERPQAPPTPEPEQAPAPRRVTPPSTSPAAEAAGEAPRMPASETQPAPRQARDATRSSAGSETGAGAIEGADYLVRRGDTLWSIATRVRPDDSLTVNQTMLAIYEANREAFANNINIMSAGYRLRLPGADDVFRISRSEALAEVQRQHAAWGGGQRVIPDTTQPSLTLVPPDEEAATPGTGVYEGPDQSEPVTEVDPDAARMREIEQLLADRQDGLIEITDTDLAALQNELARLRGEEPPAEPVETAADEIEPEPVAADQGEGVFVDDTGGAADETETEAPAEATDTGTPAEPRPAPRVVSTRGSGDSLVDTILGALKSIWVLIGLALVLVAGVLVWFVRRAAHGGDDEESTGVWDRLEGEDFDTDAKASTARLSALARDEEDAIVVVEQRSAPQSDLRRTAALDVRKAPKPAPEPEPVDEVSLEDTFSSETAINLDQSDPVAEADFHMAYGLYDQAADLINGALEAEPGREDLMAKLCEIYFVWGNRDAFIDAARNLKDALGGAEDPEWDKIVIMGRQIAADEDMFSDSGRASPTKAVDLSFEAGLEETGALDMDLADDDIGGASDVIDLGADLPARDQDEDGLDFIFDTVNTGGSVAREMSREEKADLEAIFDDSTQDAPTMQQQRADSTTSTPTIEEQFAAFGGTAKMPSLDDAEEVELGGDDETRVADATAEIELDDLGLDLDGLEETKLASDLDDDDAGLLNDLDDTTESRSLRFDDLEATGRNLALDSEELEATGRNYELDDELTAETKEMPAFDETTSRSRTYGGDEDTDAGVDTSLLDATGQTQILPEDFTVETTGGTRRSRVLSDEDVTLLASDYGEDEEPAGDDEIETLLAPMDDEDTEAGDFDFAKTEALPKDSFDADFGRRTAGGTDMDLDLDDLTAALRFSEADTVNQTRDDATVEQRRPTRRSFSSDFEDDSPTAAISVDDMSEELADARTMTEVGTKLDLARAYVDMGDPGGARSILEEVLDEGDEAQRQQARQLLDSLPG